MSASRHEQASLHIPVLQAEVVELLDLRAGHTVLDGTLGGGGHAQLILDRIGPSGRLIALDRDPVAVERAQARFAARPATFVQENFCHALAVLRRLQVSHVHAALLDLGLSSDQLDADDRGFSFQQSGMLDMRFDPTEGTPAWQLLARLSERALADMIYRYGEERYSRRIARAIVLQRRRQPIKMTAELADIVRRCIPFRRRQKIDPATRTFQALRIAVNDELASLERFLAVLPDLLAGGARSAIISFHSLEDRLVKNAYRQNSNFEMITRKPVRPSEEEVRTNSRARSARLRVVARRERVP